MKIVAAGVLFLLASQGLCQTPAKEGDALQALVLEMRQLRQAIEAQTLVSQRVQIALYTLQMQDAAVARDAQAVDDARKKCRAMEDDKQHAETRNQDIESRLAAGNMSEAETKEMRLMLPQFKKEIETRAADLRSCQAAESDAGVLLRKDQTRLNELRDRIEILDKGLEKLGFNGK